MTSYFQYGGHHVNVAASERRRSNAASPLHRQLPACESVPDPQHIRTT